VTGGDAQHDTPPDPTAAGEDGVAAATARRRVGSPKAGQINWEGASATEQLISLGS